MNMENREFAKKFEKRTLKNECSELLAIFTLTLHKI